MAERELIASWHDGSSIGRFIEGPSADIRFEYDPGYRGLPISVSLPCPPAQHAPAAAARFLDNLLPTPTRVRSALAANQLHEALDDVSLLGHIGLECPGRLMLCWPGLTASLRTHQEALLDKACFMRWVKDPANQPLMPINSGRIAFTISGSRPKAILDFRDHGSWTPIIPFMSASSTHLLKASSTGDSLHEAIEEWFCLQLAEKVIGPALVARGEVWRQCLKLERYDRRLLAGQICRIHQEDFAQALGISSAESKSDAEDADPATSSLLARAGALLDQLGREGRIAVPALQKQRLFRQLLVRLLLGDSGLGLKKFSLIHHENGQSELAPLYGLRCTPAVEPADSSIGDQHSGSGLLIGRDRQHPHFNERAGIDCASLQLGLSRRYAAIELNELRESILKLPGSLWSIKLAQRYPEAEPTILRILETLRERLE